MAKAIWTPARVILRTINQSFAPLSMGIYYAVKRYNVPCLFIKTVSDNADSSANISFAEVIENGVDAYVGIVEKLLTKLDMAML